MKPETIRRRVAIIGGGVSGLSAAFFLEEREGLEVTLYEKDGRLGGHAMTFEVPRQGGGTLPIDPVVCLFLRSRHPYFTAWMENLSVATSSFTFENYLWDGHQGRGLLLTPDKRKIMAFAGRSLAYLSDLMVFRRLLRKVEELDQKGLLKDELLMKDFLAQVPGADRRFVEEVFFPLMQFAFHADREALYDLPCGATMRSYAQAAKRPESAYFITGGVRRYVETVQSQIRRATIRVGAGVERLARAGSKAAWRIQASDGSIEEYDHVVLAVWPNQAATLLEGCMDPPAELPDDIATLARSLGSVERSYCRATIHSDRRLMPEERRHWSTYCYKYMPYLRKCFATIWSGQIHDEPIFTSYDWSEKEEGVSDESTQTRIQGAPLGVNIHFRTPPRAPLNEARARVASMQGKHGLWFAGAYLRATGFHEDALVSSLEVIRRIVPEHQALPRFRELIARFEANRASWERGRRRRVARSNGRFRSLDSNQPSFQKGPGG